MTLKFQKSLLNCKMMSSRKISQIHKTIKQEDYLRIVKESCEASLKKIFPLKGNRNLNYWWNDEIVRIRGEVSRRGD